MMVCLQNVSRGLSVVLAAAMLAVTVVPASVAQSNDNYEDHYLNNQWRRDAERTRDRRRERYEHRYNEHRYDNDRGRYERRYRSRDRGLYRHRRHHDDAGAAIVGGILGLMTGMALGTVPPDSRARAPRNYRGRYPAWSPAWYRYCERRYRSFNRRTGYFLGYDGRYHFCR